MKRILTTAMVVLVLASLTPRPAIADQNEDNIRELLVVTNTLAIAEQVMQPVMQHISELLITLNPSSADLVREVLLVEFQQVWRENASGYEQLLVIAYQEHFTPAEIEGLLEFYKTPLGQSLIEKTPALLQDSQAAGAVWGQQIAETAYERVVQRLRDEGLEVPS